MQRFFNLNQDDYRKLVSGQATGFCAAILRLFLCIAAALYSAVIVLRNFLYSKGILKAHRANALVICIGNITTGGTGKTPLVVWLCNLITKHSTLNTKNCSCAVLTRGYKARRASCVMRRAKNRRNTIYDIRNTIDEPAILAESCPQAKVVINPNRVAGAAEAVSKLDADVLIMDDGFQHRRLARDLDIVAIDATCPFGYGKILPAGLLREPVSGLKRADAVIITRADQVTDAELTRLEKKLRLINPDMIIAKSIHSPTYVKSADGRETAIEELKGKKIFAFCGIGNPDAFFSTIKKLGCDLVGSEIYDDHYHYTDEDIERIFKQAEHFKADMVLTTQKDWTKILNSQFSILNSKDIPLSYLAIEIKFLAAEDKLRDLIEHTLAGTITKN